MPGMLLAFLALLALCLAYTGLPGVRGGAAPLLAVATVMVFFTLAGVAGLLVPAAWAFCALCLALGGFALWRGRAGLLRRLWCPGFALFAGAGLALLALLAVRQPVFSQWDEFSFWGTAGKLVKQQGVLHTLADVGWPWTQTQSPGLILLGWFVQAFSPGFAPWAVYWGYGLLFFACAAALLAPFGWRQWRVVVPLAVAGLLLPFVFTVYYHTTQLAPAYLSAYADVPAGLLMGGALALYFGAAVPAADAGSFPGAAAGRGAGLPARAGGGHGAPLARGGCAAEQAVAGMAARWPAALALAALALVKDNVLSVALVAAGIMAADLVLFGGRRPVRGGAASKRRASAGAPAGGGTPGALAGSAALDDPTGSTVLEATADGDAPGAIAGGGTSGAQAGNAALDDPTGSTVLEAPAGGDAPGAIAGGGTPGALAGSAATNDPTGGTALGAPAGRATAKAPAGPPAPGGGRAPGGFAQKALAALARPGSLPRRLAGALGLLAAPLLASRVWSGHTGMLVRQAAGTEAGESNISPFAALFQVVEQLFIPAARTERFAAVTGSMWDGFMGRVVSGGQVLDERFNISMLGSAAATCGVILLLFVLAAALAGSRRGALRVALAGGLAAAGFAAYNLTLLAYYAFMNKDAATAYGAPQYERYLACYLPGALVLALLLLALAARPGIRRAGLAGAATLIFCAALAVRFAVLVRPGYSLLDYPDRLYAPQRAGQAQVEALARDIEPGERVFFVCQGDGGGERWFHTSYYLLPTVLEYSLSGGDRLTPPPDGLAEYSTRAYQSLEDVRAYLDERGIALIWVDQPDADFIESYGALFGRAPAVGDEGPALYRRGDDGLYWPV